MTDEGGECKGAVDLSFFKKLFLTFNPICSIYVLVGVRPFDPLIDIVNQPWRGFKPPKRQLPEADGAGTLASICSR